MASPHRWLLALVLGIVSHTPAEAQGSPSGRAVAVIPDAAAERPEGSRALAVQQPVYMGDLVRTGPNGEAQFIFHDSTRLVVGSQSALQIDRHILRNQRTARNLTVNALRGSFRFFSGNSPSSAYTVQTPSATIGIRG
jgi:hypothetical protein